MIRSSRQAHRRLLVLMALLGLVVPLLAAPVAAASPTVRAASARIVDRGVVVPRVAAEAARGVDRPASDHATLRRPGPSEVADGRTMDLKVERLRSALPDVVSKEAFTGIGEVPDGLGLEPPDPWIAASTTHLVQSTNGLVRITDRAGKLAVSLPTWALFALDPSEADADPRILWDDIHDRWVGVLFSFQIDYSLNFLNVAVSEGTDPTGAWDVFAIPYFDESDVPTIPDYPGIATSSDKIVLTANEFQDRGGPVPVFVGASVLVLRWTEILAGQTPVITQWTLADDSLFSIRPGLVVGNAGVVHLVAQADTNEVMYARLSGTAPAVTWQNLSFATGLHGFCDAYAPRQPGDPSTIKNAVDGRPTDAVWRDGRLAFVSTCAVSNDGGATVDDYVRVTTLDTSSTAPSIAEDILIGSAGSDAFMGGVGYSGDGTLFVSYSHSSPTDYVSTYATARYAGGWTGSTLVTAGSSTYPGTRWGDYVGVATDPAGTAAVWQSNEVADELGGWQTSVSRLILDLSAPTVSGPNQGLVAGTTVGGLSVPVKVYWSASDQGSGIARNWLYTDQFNTGLAYAGNVATTSVVRSHFWRSSTASGDVSYQYGAGADDGYGNQSTLVTGSRLSPIVYQQTSTAFTYSTGWSSSSSTAFLGGSVKYSSTAGRSVTFRTSGRSFGFVTTRASSRGKVKVYIDGVYKKTVSLTGSPTRYRYLAYVASFSTSGTHTIKLVVYSGRVDVDAFVVLK